MTEIERRLPREIHNGQIDTYVEPFVGGGALFFHIAQNYKSIKHFYLLDINEDLINCYNAIRDDVNSLIEALKSLEEEFYSEKKSKRERLYYDTRDEFNSERSSAKLIFLNKTCYNGLYRVNKKGGFNVPFGDYKNPTICNEENLRAASVVLQNAEIICAGFEQSDQYITENTFVYFDPPYIPLSPTASFTSYSKEDFDNEDQIHLAEFCKKIDEKGAKFLLSNSCPKKGNKNGRFFKDHYRGFNIETVKANRSINCKPSGRGQIKELIITNYIERA